MLATALSRLDPRPRVLINGSAIGYYGSRGDDVLAESASAGSGFLAEVCVDASEGEESVALAGGPEILTQRDLADIAFDVVGKPVKVTVVPAWLCNAVVKGIGLLSTQFGDLAEFIVRSGEVDGVGPPRGTITVREYFEALAAGKPDV